ncbi:MAG: RNA-binding S4 domain-containing protein [Mycoplasmataceae bacterium]|jgi:ribosome-associated protein YbcJ (S4-like RNA binding protein)|nr:RNA-binding S4 domain-containing protein [Mycoplasmataceae bacterium]
MVKATFITINDNYITLGQFLKLAKIIVNGGQARIFLATNTVLINNIREQRRGKKIYCGDTINIVDKQFVIQHRSS